MSSSDPLAPIAPQYKAASPTTLILKEKKMSLTGDSSTIKDTDGNTVFQVDAKHLSMAERRLLKDTGGNVIGQLRKKRISVLHPACYVGTESNEKVCMVKLKGVLNILKCDADICLGDTVIGEVSGNWRAKTFTIFLNGMEAASIKRKTNFSSFVLDADSYCIDVQPGVDLAFVSLIVLALDELYHE